MVQISLSFFSDLKHIFIAYDYYKLGIYLQKKFLGKKFSGKLYLENRWELSTATSSDQSNKCLNEKIFYKLITFRAADELTSLQINSCFIVQKK